MLRSISRKLEEAMVKGRSEILDKRFNQAASLHQLPPNFMSVVASRVEETLLMATSDKMQPFLDQMRELFDGAVSKVPKEVLDSVRGSKDSDTALHDAYMLGQFNFAYSLIANAASKRIPERFISIIDAPENEKYMRALADKSLSVASLKAAVNEDESVVRKKLALFREEGIADFRREGEDLVNFLTPAAQTMVWSIYG